MLQLEFDGWFQCRLATNPDPSDEPRGVSGYTFALPGEPDFDRIIRFHDPIEPRMHGPKVGVQVRRVYLDGILADGHRLFGARVSLLDDPKFESRNLLVTEDRAGVGIIHPFHVEIAADGLNIRRKDLLDPEDVDRNLHELTYEQMHRRAPTTLDGMVRDVARIAAATGITDAGAHRRRRKELLKSELDEEQDPLRRIALEKRIAELELTDPGDMRLLSMQLYQSRAFQINGPADVADEIGTTDLRLDTDRAWPIEFWMGAWDADALCGFVSGMLTILRRSREDNDTADYTITQSSRQQQ